MTEAIHSTPQARISLLAPEVEQRQYSPAAQFEGLGEAVMVVNGRLSYMYELLRRLTPEKKFKDTVEQLDKDIADEQKAAQQSAGSDPRVDELVTRMNQLTEDLPGLISGAIVQVLGSKQPIQEAPESIAPDDGDGGVDWGEGENTKGKGRGRGRNS